MNDLNYFFNPAQIAVIGASSSPQKIGYAILDNIVKSGYQGKIYPVNPKEEEIAGIKCYKSIGDIDSSVDLAVISVPSRFVSQVAEECGKAGVKGLNVITAGFKEIGSEGLKEERKLIAICKKYGMHMLGPNCVGLMDTHTPVNASFAKGFPEEGKISFISQSGAMLLSILDWSFQMNIGFSRFVSLGNKADLSEIDFIASCADDPNTNVILCYIEDVVDGPRFVEVCSEVSKRKPIIILKSGTSTAGAQAASSHTGALAGSNRAYEAAFKQSGVLRVNSMNELFDLARAFSTQPIPNGSRVAIVTNAGGAAIVTTDAIERFGLQMARFTKDTIDKMRNNLPPEGNIYNPVDILGDATVERYHFALETVLEDDNVDSALVLLCPTAVIEARQTAETIVALKNKYKDKPVMAVYMGGKALANGKKYLVENDIPCFTFPESSVRALEGMVRYAEYRRTKPPVSSDSFKNIDKETVRKILDDVLADRRAVLLGYEATQVMDAYGIPVSKSALAKTEDEACKISEEIGYPVALKISSPRIAHKTDVGGVKIGLLSENQVRKGFRNIMDSVRHHMPDAPIYGVEVQNMVDEGIEVIIGMSRDVQFGPLVVFGLGGIYVNLLKDVSFRLASALTSVEEAKRMISETKAYTLLKGYRGAKPADINALADTLLRTARLVRDFSEITEMDINPVRVHSRGTTALDVKITIEVNE
ncbi:MAG TPA: CoA-binding protein [Firmicutes bacterium]|nr:CoA-binding protein [Bacillota bacterium]